MKTVIKDYIRTQLGTNPAWATRAIVKLYELQTAAEQASQTTRNVNGAGFNSTDATILSSFAEQILKGRTLSQKQLAISFKRLPKYSRQISNLIPAERLEALATEAA